MENDSIRASGADTLVDIWIDGKVRAICVQPAAIGAAIGFDQAAKMSEEERCEFIRKNLAKLVKAAKAQLRDNDPGAASVSIGTDFAGPGASPAGDRRKGDRRKVDRRKAERPPATLPHGERRRSERRKSDRRTPPKGRRAP